MIRINLLPAKRARKQDAGRRQLAAMGAGLLVAAAALVFVHVSISNEIEASQAVNSAITRDIEKYKAEMGDYDKIRGQREDLLKQQKTIVALQTARTGPVYLLRELSEILTPGKGPTFDRVTYEETLRRDPNAGFNASWDTRRVWIESFEEENKKVKIKGGAKSNEDVAEFLKRLQSSVYFQDVTPESTSQVAASATQVKHLTFSLTTGVSY